MSKTPNVPFTYYGGKQKHLDFLLPLMPDTSEIVHFVDVFGGSAAVILNAPDYHQRTYNDIDGEVVNFFRQLRDNTQEMIDRVALTPYARDELIAAAEPTDDPVEAARRFYIKARQSRNGVISKVSGNRWRRVTRSRPNVPVGDTWSRAPDRMLMVARQLTRICIENDDAIKVISDYDAPTTFFYCDPPYVHDSRSGDKNAYRHEMTDEQHRTLCHALRDIQGKAMISGYDNALYPSILCIDEGWRKVDDREKYNNNAQSIRQETVWLNYEPTKNTTHLDF